MKLLIIFLAVFYGSRLGSSVPQKNCFCSDHTETDHRGQQIGKCQTKFSGKNWCYIESNSNCADKKKSKRGHNLFWSHVACQRKPITPPSSVKKVLFMRSNFQGTTWTTLSVPDFSLISAKCAVPDPLMEGSNVFGQTINGKTYICDYNQPTSKCKSYNAKKNSWELEEGMKFQEKKRASYPASTLVPGANPKWILTSYNAVEEWTPATRNWKLSSDYTLPSFSPYVPEIRQCIVPVGTKIMHIGGFGVCGHRCYHGRSGKVFLDDKELASLNVPRFQHTCINYKNKIYVAGGTGDERWSPTKVEVYDFSTNTWNYGPTLPIQTLDNFPKLKEIEGELYYIGGSGIGKIYKLGDQTWEEVATIPKAYRHAMVMVMEVTC